MRKCNFYLSFFIFIFVCLGLAVLPNFINAQNLPDKNSSSSSTNDSKKNNNSNPNTTEIKYNFIVVPINLSSRTEQSMITSPTPTPIPTKKSQNIQNQGAHSYSIYIKEMIPNFLKGKLFLIENWQWMFLLLIILIGVIIEKVINHSTRESFDRWNWLKKIQNKEELKKSVARPVSTFAMGLFWLFTVSWIALPESLHNILILASKFIVVTSGVWFAYKTVDVISEFLMMKALKTESKMDDLLVPMFKKTLKILVIAFGIVFIADNFNINITSLLAGLGLGGLAMALAAKDTLENVFGSITVLIDHPFQIGDWIIIPEDKVEGTVHELGFRSTKILTFYNSIITVPNSRLIRAVVDNMGARKYRRIRTYISITYDTPPEKIEAFCEGIRELIILNPFTLKENFNVFFNEFKESSLDILVSCFLQVPDIKSELRERHNLFTNIIRLSKKLGVEFAFPTRTVYTKDVSSTDAKIDNISSVDEALELGKKYADEIHKSLKK